MTIRLGIIGAGNISRFHIEAFASLDAKIAVIAATPKSLNAEIVAAKYGIPLVLDKWQDIINKEFNLDGIIVCTPPSVTLDVLRHLYNFGKPILVEKPVSYNPELLKEIINLSSSPIYVGYNRRFYESVSSLKNLVQENEVFFNVTIVEPSIMNSPDVLEEIVCGNSVHIFDVCLHVFGLLQLVDIHVLENNLGITAKFTNKSNKFVGTLQILFGVPKNSSIEIYGDNLRGNLSPIESLELFDSFRVLEPTEDKPIRRYIPAWNKKSNSIVSSSAEFKPGFLSQAKAFMQVCLGGGNNFLCDISQATQTSEMAREIYKHAASAMISSKSN